MRPPLLRLYLHALHALDRLRLRVLTWRHPGLELHPTASANLAHARFDLAPGARLRIGPGVATERRHQALTFLLEPGAVVEIGPRTWLRTQVQPLSVSAFAGARITLGADGLLNGCHVSAKGSVAIGERALIGTGTRIFDADQHAFDASTPERVEPVRIGDHVWLASDVTVLRGVTIGDHSVVGTRSIVTADIPPHTLAFGAPARPRGEVGDRSRVR